MDPKEFPLLSKNETSLSATVWPNPSRQPIYLIDQLETSSLGDILNVFKEIRPFSNFGKEFSVLKELCYKLKTCNDDFSNILVLVDGMMSLFERCFVQSILTVKI